MDLTMNEHGDEILVHVDDDISFLVRVLNLGSWDYKNEEYVNDYQVEMTFKDYSYAIIHFDLNEMFNKELDEVNEILRPQTKEKTQRILEEYFSDPENLPIPRPEDN